MGALDGILCHCDVDPEGHAPGEQGCGSVVKAGAPRPWDADGNHPSVIGVSGGLLYGKLGARGTCPDCKRTQRVVRIETRAHLYPAKPGAVLNVAPGMAPHKVKGESCPGAGAVPVETRYTPGRELASWTSQYGTEAVA